MNTLTKITLSAMMLFISFLVYGIQDGQRKFNSNIAASNSNIEMKKMAEGAAGYGYLCKIYLLKV